MAVPEPVIAVLLSPSVRPARSATGQGGRTAEGRVQWCPVYGERLCVRHGYGRHGYGNHGYCKHWYGRHGYVKRVYGKHVKAPRKWPSVVIDSRKSDVNDLTVVHFGEPGERPLFVPLRGIPHSTGDDRDGASCLLVHRLGEAQRLLDEGLDDL